MIKTIVIDIEGTTSSISFVHEVLFPYAYERKADFLKENWDNEAVKKAVLEVAKLENLTDYDHVKITEILRDWIKGDRKITPLKDIQGIMWEEGYKKGYFTSHVYLDAYEQLSFWYDQKIPMYIYSSGSIQAQKLFFGYSEYGDLLHFFSGFFDTNTGGKKEANSYQKIADAIGLSTSEILFLSDIEAEVDAALSVGMSTVWVIRDEILFNKFKNSDSPHQIVNDFYQIKQDFFCDN